MQRSCMAFFPPASHRPDPFIFPVLIPPLEAFAVSHCSPRRLHSLRCIPALPCTDSFFQLSLLLLHFLIALSFIKLVISWLLHILVGIWFGPPLPGGGHIVMLVDQRNPPLGTKGSTPRPPLQGISPLKRAEPCWSLGNAGGGQCDSFWRNMYRSTGRRSWLR